MEVKESGKIVEGEIDAVIVKSMMVVSHVKPRSTVMTTLLANAPNSGTLMKLSKYSKHATAQVAIAQVAIDQMAKFIPRH